MVRALSYRLLLREELLHSTALRTHCVYVLSMITDLYKGGTL
jgi:hypothetical protein